MNLFDFTAVVFDVDGVLLMNTPDAHAPETLGWQGYTYISNPQFAKDFNFDH